MVQIFYGSTGFIYKQFYQCYYFFLIVTYGLFSIFASLSYEKGGEIRKSSIDFTLEIVVNVKLYRSLLPISTVSISSVKPCDLCIVKDLSIFKGICFRLPLSTRLIGTSLGFYLSNGRLM